jgi:hypothetical protein
MKVIFFALIATLATVGPALADPVILPIAYALFAGPLGGVLTFGALYNIAAATSLAGAVIVHWRKRK